MSTEKGGYQAPLPVKGEVVATQPAETVVAATVAAHAPWPVQLCCYDNCNCGADLPLCCYAAWCAPCLCLRSGSSACSHFHSPSAGPSSLSLPLALHLAVSLPLALALPLFLHPHLSGETPAVAPGAMMVHAVSLPLPRRHAQPPQSWWA